MEVHGFVQTESTIELPKVTNSWCVRFRGATEIGGAPFLTFIFENCWAVMLAGRIGLQAAFAAKARVTQAGVALNAVRVPRPLRGLLLYLPALSATPS